MIKDVKPRIAIKSYGIQVLNYTNTCAHGSFRNCMKCAVRVEELVHKTLPNMFQNECTKPQIKNIVGSSIEKVLVHCQTKK